MDIPKRPGRCIYVGSLYEYKRLPLLLKAAESIAANVPQFELVVVGDGPLRPWLQNEAEIRPWLRYEGASHGPARDKLFVSSELTLVTGTVGLVIVDSFAARAPIVAIDKRCTAQKSSISKMESTGDWSHLDQLSNMQKQ